MKTITLEQAESFAKAKGLIERLAELRDYYETFTEADKSFLNGCIDFYKEHCNEIV